MYRENDMLAAQAAQVAHALAHPVRLQILEALADGAAYVMDLTTALGRRQANISQHLAVLREAGLVQAEREGMTVRYTLRSPQVVQVLEALAGLGRDVPFTAVGRRRRHRRGGRGGGPRRFSP